MLNEPTCTSTTKASTTSSRNTSPSTKSLSQRLSRSASRRCAIFSRRTRRVLEHQHVYAMYFYDAIGIKSLRFPLPHLYPGAAIYKAAVVTVTVNANVIVNETHCLNPRLRSFASRLSFFIVLCVTPLTRNNVTETTVRQPLPLSLNFLSLLIIDLTSKTSTFF